MRGARGRGRTIGRLGLSLHVVQQPVHRVLGLIGDALLALLHLLVRVVLRVSPGGAAAVGDAAVGADVHRVRVGPEQELYGRADGREQVSPAHDEVHQHLLQLRRAERGQAQRFSHLDAQLHAPLLVRAAVGLFLLLHLGLRRGRLLPRLLDLGAEGLDRFAFLLQRRVGVGRPLRAHARARLQRGHAVAQLARLLHRLLLARVPAPLLLVLIGAVATVCAGEGAAVGACAARRTGRPPCRAPHTPSLTRDEKMYLPRWPRLRQ